MSRNRARTLVTVALAALAVFATSSSADAAPSLGRQTLSCSYGSVATTPPGGSATQGYVNSTVADARWWVGIWHWTGQWQFLGWSQEFGAQVASNGGPSIGSAYGYIGTFRWSNGTPITSVSFNAVHGDYYALVNYVADSSGGVFNYSYTAGGSYYCQA